MTDLFVQPPVGVWDTSPERRALWAVKQVREYIVRTKPEKRQIDAWAKKLARAYEKPVTSFDWKGWYRRNVDGQVFASDDDVHDLIYGVAVPEGISFAKVEQLVEELHQAAGGVRTSAEGLPFDPADLEAAIATVGEQIAGLDANAREMLRGMMRVAMQEREGQFAFAKRIRQEWSDFSKTRANLVAVTEWNRAASAATYIGYVKQGVETKVWMTAGDDRVCPTCEQNSADGEIPMQQEFESGDLYPPAHPGCRCNISAA